MPVRHIGGSPELNRTQNGAECAELRLSPPLQSERRKQIRTYLQRTARIPRRSRRGELSEKSRGGFKEERLL